MKQDPQKHPLNAHPLKGNRKAYKSMNVTGDYRAVFLLGKNAVTFGDRGTHSELYS